ncbi:hypothetical protein BDW72DRAFT_182280 [Aspergillus terricola var. indicus]
MKNHTSPSLSVPAPFTAPLLSGRLIREPCLFPCHFGRLFSIHVKRLVTMRKEM